MVVVLHAYTNGRSDQSGRFIKEKSQDYLFQAQIHRAEGCVLLGHNSDAGNGRVFVARVGIPGLTKVHTLRHTFASHLVMQGVDLPTVGRLMGHTDIATTMIYAHLAPDRLANAVTKLPFGKL